VGCGCRGSALGEALVADGWLVRGTYRDPSRAGAIEAAGIEAVQADPDRMGEVLDHVGDVALVIWLMGTAAGSAKAVVGLHDSRLGRLLEELVDTPVRGFIYEAAGTAAPAALARGTELVEAAGRTWRIPVQVVDEDPGAYAAWLAAMTGAVGRLISA
jgi:uncharacterized protein YbjT (DUF2867 family)